MVEVVNNPRAYAELNDSQALMAAFDKLNVPVNEITKPKKVLKPTQNQKRRRERLNRNFDFGVESNPTRRTRT